MQTEQPVEKVLPENGCAMIGMELNRYRERCGTLGATESARMVPRNDTNYQFKKVISNSKSHALGKF